MKPFTIAFQGMFGAYSHEALEHFSSAHGFPVTVLPSHTFNDLFPALEGDCGLAFVPIENSTTGSVVPAYDYFARSKNFEIIGEHVENIRHCLLGLPGSTLLSVKKVFSHPQALAQCEHYINTAGLLPVAHTDTAGSAKEISEGSDISLASIASARAGELYGLHILKRDIQDNPHNQTRFFLVKKKNTHFSFEDTLKASTKTSLIVTVPDAPGALYSCLGVFARRYINLVKLESRPDPDQNFKYLFFIDCAVSLTETAMQDALGELTTYAEEVHILGSYPGVI